MGWKIRVPYVTFFFFFFKCMCRQKKTLVIFARKTGDVIHALETMSIIFHNTKKTLVVMCNTKKKIAKRKIFNVLYYFIDKKHSRCFQSVTGL